MADSENNEQAEIGIPVPPFPPYPPYPPCPPPPCPSAFAIQRNAKAIASTIKALQQLQEEVDALSVGGIPSTGTLSERLIALETGLAALTNEVDGAGGLADRLTAVELQTSSIDAVRQQISDTNRALVATQSNLARLEERVRALEEGGGVSPDIAERVGKLEDAFYQGTQAQIETSDGTMISVPVSSVVTDDSDSSV